MIQTVDRPKPNGAALFTLPLEEVLEDRQFNIRIFYGDIDQLAVQLMTEGQHEPIKVRQEEGRYFIVDGHRRQRAFARSRQLRIERRGERYMVCESGRPLREAPGPLHENFSAERIQCREIDPRRDETELFASQLIYNSGKPFTVLERMIFISRLSRHHAYTREQLALRTGFSRTYIANALALNAADPRLLDYVREERISQKLALRLLRMYTAEEQIGRIRAAWAVAEKHGREKILPKDFDWPGGPERAPSSGAKAVDPVRQRLRGLTRRLEDSMRYPPNPSAEARLGALVQIHRYAMGELDYPVLEAFLLGRE